MVGGRGWTLFMKYKSYIQSNDWKETKKYLSFIKNKNCFVCQTTENLRVHHLHYKTLGYEDGSELVYLCLQHHQELHYKNGKIPLDSDENIIRLFQRLKSMKRNYDNNQFKIKKFLKIAENMDNEFYELVSNF